VVMLKRGKVVASGGIEVLPLGITSAP
jgi:hypothetical protein